MGGSETSEEEQAVKWRTSYSEMDHEAVVKRLNFNLGAFEFDAIPIDQMLAEAKGQVEGIGGDAIKETKERVYARIVEYLQLEGYPTDARPEFNRACVIDLVAYIIGPILFYSGKETGRRLRLAREREIISNDSETGGFGEFVVVDESVGGYEDAKFVLIIEPKQSSLGEAIKPCLLAMNDMLGSNGGGEVYGFVTTGEDWRMARYDGIRFQIAEKFTVLFGTISENKDRWMKEGSVLVDCLTVALRGGGIVVGAGEDVVS